MTSKEGASRGFDTGISSNFIKKKLTLKKIQHLEVKDPVFCSEAEPPCQCLPRIILGVLNMEGSF